MTSPPHRRCGVKWRNLTRSGDGDSAIDLRRDKPDSMTYRVSKRFDSFPIRSPVLFLINHTDQSIRVPVPGSWGDLLSASDVVDAIDVAGNGAAAPQMAALQMKEA